MRSGILRRWLLKGKDAINTLVKINLIKTLYINLKCLPIRQALHFPIFLYGRIECIGLYRGCLVIGSERSEHIHKGMIRIGIYRSPIHSGRKKSTLIRIGSRSSKIEFGESVEIRRGCSILSIGVNSCLHFDDDVFINQDSLIYCSKSVHIGEACRLGWCAEIYDTNFHFTIDTKNGKIKNREQPVVIGKYVWIGNHSTISKGIMPDYSILASRSLLNKDFSDIDSKGTVFAGIPAKPISYGVYRIFNKSKENELASLFISNPDEDIFVDEKSVLSFLN